MPRERLSMCKIKEILRLKAQGLSHRAIGASCGLGAGTVCEYLGRARSCGVSWPLPDDLSDAEIERRLFPPTRPPSTSRAVPDWTYVARELSRKGVTLLLLWEEYRAQHPDGYGYARFCGLYHEHSITANPVMHLEHKAGEKLFVDYAGQVVPIVDRHTGQVHDAQIFVATIGASSYTFAEPTLTQTKQDWIGSHMRAFEFFGGVPQIVVPDNIKTGIKSPCFYEPDINRTYQEMAQHYGVAIIPARVRKPRDKAKVESHVRIVEQRILAPLRNRTFFSLESLSEAIAELLDDLNDRPFQKLLGTRRQAFEQIDRPALMPLPDTPYVFADWTKARVNVDYHIAVRDGYYSVPYTLIKEEVDVRITARIVEVLHKGKRVASHARCSYKGQYSTNPDHMPKTHSAYVDWQPTRLVRWAAQTGPRTSEIVAEILKRRIHPQQGYRACLGLIRLEKVHGANRLEAACDRALSAGAISYRSVKSILQNKLDLTESPDEAQLAICPAHDNVRGPGYYS
jgi:transposase